MAADDVGFVVQHWLESFEDSHAAGLLPSRLYYAAYRELVAEILKRGRVEVHVAFVADDPKRILGFVIVERGPFLFETPTGPRRMHADAVHYLYTKVQYRRTGVARGLLELAGIRASEQHLTTFTTPAGRDFVAHLRAATRFEPRIVRLTPKSTTQETACASR
jgi:GNAT superfamily N-acetyltransferase